MSAYVTEKIESGRIHLPPEIKTYYANVSTLIKELNRRGFEVTIPPSLYRQKSGSVKNAAPEQLIQIRDGAGKRFSEKTLGKFLAQNPKAINEELWQRIEKVLDQYDAVKPLIEYHNDRVHLLQKRARIKGTLLGAGAGIVGTGAMAWRMRRTRQIVRRKTMRK